MVQRLALSLCVGLSVLLGLDPFRSSIAGTAGAIALLILAEGLREEKLVSSLIWGLVCSLFVSVLAFYWVMSGLMVIGHMSVIAALPLYLVHALLFNLKLPLLLVGIRLLPKVPLIFSAPVLAVIGDRFLPQIFPWYWGSLLGGGLIVQSASMIGVFGLTFLLFVQANVIVSFFKFIRSKTRPELPAVISLAVLTLFYVYSIVRDVTPVEFTKSVRIGYIQPGTAIGLSELKDNDEFAKQSLTRVFNLGLKSILDSAGTIDLLILPESSIPFLGTRDTAENRKEHIYSPTYLAVIAFLSRYGETDVLYNELNHEDGRLFNSATIFNRRGRITGSYKKRQLLPFGEYLPGESLFPIRRIFTEASNYSSGDRAEVLSFLSVQKRSERKMNPIDAAQMKMLSDPALALANWPKNLTYEKAGKLEEPVAIAPLICYEGMFPGVVRSFFNGPQNAPQKNPELLINIANDSWFGQSYENNQHSGTTRIRSIETGRFLLRITLSGLTAIFDPRGRDLLELPQGEQTAGVVELPIDGARDTIYLSYGELILAIITLVWLICGLVFMRRT